LTVGTVADPTMRVAVGRATVPASQIEMLEQRVHERTTDLQQTNKLLETLSITDGLTGLYNRRYFDEIYTWK
jgi:PleD family two-component response regulator